MIDFKVGIIGAGKIAGIVADTLNQLPQFVPYAIGSRDIDKANEFGDKYNIERRYGSYEELINDPDVELVYVATPHSEHYANAKMCLEAGKHVLVEKAFSYDSVTTAELITMAEEKKLFCGEAMWIRFLPMYKMLMQQIEQGVIGRVTGITCSLGYDLRTKERILKPELAGGVLLDLGVYPLNLVSMIFGNEPMTITSSCAKLETGVDGQCTVQMNYKGAKCATFFCTMMYKPDNNAIIYGDRGYIEIDNINNPETFRIYHGDHNMVFEARKPERQISGYEYEFIAARDAIIVGASQCPDMMHEDTLKVMRMCDGLRRTWGVKFPMDAEIPAKTQE